jgi:hypothetical protein
LRRGRESLLRYARYCARVAIAGVAGPGPSVRRSGRRIRLTRAAGSGMRHRNQPALARAVQPGPQIVALKAVLNRSPRQTTADRSRSYGPCFVLWKRNRRLGASGATSTREPLSWQMPSHVPGSRLSIAATRRLAAQWRTSGSALGLRLKWRNGYRYRLLTLRTGRLQGSTPSTKLKSVVCAAERRISCGMGCRPGTGCWTEGRSRRLSVNPLAACLCARAPKIFSHRRGAPALQSHRGRFPAML